MSDAPWFDLAKKYIGLKEIPGKRNEEEIIKFFIDAGHPEIKTDEVPWCAGFANAMLVRSGYKGTNSLAARSFLAWGEALEQPRLGCIVVLRRGNSEWQGHVGFFVKRAGGRVWLRGGNQGDMVSEAAFPESSVLGYRWPIRKVKPITESKIAAGAGTVGGLETVDLGKQAADAIEKAGQAKDVADSFGLTTILTNLANNPRVWFAIATLVICGLIIYWRWREHGRGDEG